MLPIEERVLLLVTTTNGLPDDPHRRSESRHIGPEQGGTAVIDAVMFWSKPNGIPHDRLHRTLDGALDGAPPGDRIDPDPDWRRFAAVVCRAADAIRTVNPEIPRVLGTVVPIDPAFVLCMEHFGVLSRMHAVAVRGASLDGQGPSRGRWGRELDDIRAVTDLPVWVLDDGTSPVCSAHTHAGGCDRLRHMLSPFQVPVTFGIATQPHDPLLHHAGLS